MKTLQFVDDVVFQTYHALYSPENIFLHFDWQQMLDNFHPHGKGCLVVLDDVPIDGNISCFQRGKKSWSQSGCVADGF